MKKLIIGCAAVCGLLVLRRAMHSGHTMREHCQQMAGHCKQMMAGQAEGSDASSMREHCCEPPRERSEELTTV